MHGFVFLFGLWLLIYRNRGFNRKIVTELFVMVGTGLRPKPMDCIIFFTGLASLIKVGVNLLLIFDVFRDMLWLRIAIEQTYWIVVAIGFSSYFVGLLYAMPVTTRQGIFAVYQPETVFDARPLPPIHVLTPTTVQKNFLLIMGVIYPTVFGAGAGVASAVFAQIPGREDLSKILLIVQYSNWVLILWTMAIMFFYYGLKYTFILRANIIIAEAALRAPKAAFGISNLRSASPARFLFIQLQITGFGGSAITLLAGSLCMIWVLCRERILEMEDDRLPHTMAFFWTCAIAAAYFVIMALIAVQSVRNRRRGLHEPTTSLTHSFQPGSGQKNSPPATKSMYSSSQYQKHASSTLQTQTNSEARLAQRNSADLSTLHSVSSVEKDTLDSMSLEIAEEGHFKPLVAVEAIVEASQRMNHDAFNTSHSANRMEKEKRQKTSLGSPARPFMIKSQHTGESLDSNATFGPRSEPAAQDPGYSSKVHPDLRHNVFGEQSIRGTSLTSPLPTASSPSSPSFPLTAMRPTSQYTSNNSGNHDHYNYCPSGEPLRPNGNRQPSLQTSNQTSQYPASHTTSSGSLTLSTTSQSNGYAHSAPSYRRALGQGSMEHQQHQEQFIQSLQYHGSNKGLSPPPRAKRLPGSPRCAETPAVLPSSTARILLPPATSAMATMAPTSPSRNTFMNMEGQMTSGSPVSEYSHTPRVGGGVRRKSLKGTEEMPPRNPEPSWPLPPTMNV
ncbi:hypothetical protein EDD11_005724 [Mortierella claussenii]|nr:hypothetical protein EDD11_005724 [Mortierella claussenii]